MLLSFVNSVIKNLEDPIDRDFPAAWIGDTSTTEKAIAGMEDLVDEVLKLPARVWHQMFESLVTHDDTSELGKVTAPTLLVWGDADQLVTRAAQDAVVAALPNATLSVFASVGHATLGTARAIRRRADGIRQGVLCRHIVATARDSRSAQRPRRRGTRSDTHSSSDISNVWSVSAARRASTAPWAKSSLMSDGATRFASAALSFTQSTNADTDCLISAGDDARGAMPSGNAGRPGPTSAEDRACPIGGCGLSCGHGSWRGRATRPRLGSERKRGAHDRAGRRGDDEHRHR